ncbi:MAG: amidohydrolase family protein [Balneolales bacterium]|nr:amidohydrolase family protein [Balneolales bacterium]
MKKLIYVLVFSLLSISSYAQIAIKGEIVYTSAGEPIERGVILISDGKIEAVGSENRINIPSNYEILEAAVVTPGLIDAHSVVGLAGYMNQPHDQDQLETSSAIQPELRAIDAYNAREELVGHLRRHGITTIHTGHGPGALISGQTMIVKTSGETVDESVLVPAKMLAMTLGNNMNSAIRTPGTRSKAVAMVRQELIKAREYMVKQSGENPGATNLKMEALADLLNGELTAMITVHKANDIMTALRLQQEFGFEMVIDGAAESYLILDELKEAEVPVFVHPTMIRTRGEAQNASMETAATLREAGIPFAFQSGYEAYVPKTRVVLFEAGVAVAYGLGFEDALEALTINAATLLGIDDRVGSLEAGKDADIVLFDGDPFEYTTEISEVIINGVRQ